MRRFPYDTSIFVYALGGDHTYREPCPRDRAPSAAGELQGEASGDLLRSSCTSKRAAPATAAGPQRPNDIQRGIDLFEAHAELDARDSVFAALALNHSVDAILSTDGAFDGIDGLERIDPADERALATLGS